MPMDVDEMQTKLAVWAEDPDFTFDDIYDLLYDRNWLYRSYKSVKSNSGARTGGVDGQTIRDFEENLWDNLEDLGAALKAQTFDPKPVRRTYIPKGDGEERPLGIPTIKDRIVQEALRKALEPIYETDFTDRSFGFRPNRCTHDAIKVVAEGIGPAKMSWVIDADIKGFFDNVDHRTLEQILQKRITDQKIRDLIWDFLKAGIMEDGVFRHSELGTPQGGIVSPVLANIYLNELDQWIKKWTDFTTQEKHNRRKRGEENWEYARYADDFLVLTNGSKKDAERMKERVRDFVNEELDLTLSEKKTQLVHARDGFEFLGYELIQKDRNDKKGYTPKLKIPQEAINSFRGKIRSATKGGTQVGVRVKFKAIGAMVRGWGGYYKYATRSGKVFSDLENCVWENTMHWLGRKFKCSMAKVIKQHLDDHSPISMYGVEVTKMSEFENSFYIRHKKDHPYKDGTHLERKIATPPRENSWLGNEERGGEWSDQRWKALDRDNWQCQECGTDLETGQAEVHHIKPRREFQNPEEAHRLNNLESLCHDCHMDIESEKVSA
jgi:group II intron reverse transcriptase/maturase